MREVITRWPRFSASICKGFTGITVITAEYCGGKDTEYDKAITAIISAGYDATTTNDIHTRPLLYSFIYLLS